MNLQWLIYFQTIAELENYTQATKKLHVSQSNLSHAMRSLEEKLGVELFEKDGRNIRLSKYGEIFLPYVNKTLDSLDEGIAKLKEFLAPMLQKTFASLGIEPRVVSRTPSDLIIYGLVAGGRGVSVVPFPLTHYAPFGTKLLCIENDIPKRRLYLQWNKEKFLPPAARYFRDYVIRSEEVFTQYFKRVNIGPETIGG